MIRETSIIPSATDVMNRLGRVALTAAALLFLAVPLSSGAAGLKEQLVGTWKYVSADKVRDGKRTPMYGSNPQGLVIFDGTGNYALLVGRADVPKFAANNTDKGTPKEYKAVVQGSIAHFGTYTVDEAGKAIVFHVQLSSFPNWSGTEQKRPFTLTGDEMKWTIPEAASGGKGEIVLKRVK